MAAVEKAQTTVKAVVAKGRTVTVGGVDKNEKDHIIRVWSKDYAPGQIVELPADEVARLRANGALLPAEESAHINEPVIIRPR